MPVWFDLPSARTVNGKWERRENCVGQHNWSQEITVRSRTCVPGRWNKA